MGGVGAEAKGVKLKVFARVLRRPEKVRAVANSLRALFDREREDLRPSEFDTSDLTPGGRVANVVLLMIWPPKGEDPVEFGRKAVRLLEERHGVRLVWAGGVRKSGRIWLLIKLRAFRLPDYRPCRFYLTREDIYAVYRLSMGRG
ncbi:hypothetical protein Adeg_1363 [Ammonifex degensii KC4]|uniref:Uncharacterized protein n=1 Tax=Ammonifex degensii (strain DSM 10501 / KC4) TaxID=429009 RepID=C9R836_AMMDK|nr:hypothetical protein [Ammonifex degensii]ACX52465.1 hypothetical protein Adeg_1363 [Ammonifex degensii KC4]